MEKKWTDGQLSAINARGCDLLVSAGAGSGKTAVLTERIIRRLTDENSPCEISRMLVVTYTKAAAGELKERIAKAITEALALQPKNRRLARQITALDRAKISTIHSFCLDILKENQSADLPSSFRIADAAEIALLRKSIMDELIEDCYSGKATGGDIAGFEEFADNFVGNKDDEALAQVFLGIETKLSSFAEHIDFITASENELRTVTDFSNSRFAKEIFDLIKGKFTLYRDTIAPAMPELTDNPKLAKAYLPAFKADIEYCDRVLAAVDSGSYEKLTEAMNGYNKIGLTNPGKVEFTKEVLDAKGARKDFTDDAEKLTKKLFSLTSEKLIGNCKKTADMLCKLHRILEMFLDRFAEEKRTRGIVDFGDLERMAYRLLIKDGKPTDTAKAISERFDEIYIDEYQDVNSVQDAIFAAVSNGRNRFMVGDIKQSIYGFRGAEPHIFSDYRNRFGKVEGRTENDGRAVFLQNNFRCDDTVIKFSNLVSECLFTGGRGDIPFLSEDKLIHSKEGEESGEPCKVVLIESSPAAAPDDEEEYTDSIAASEVEYIADEAARLLKNGKKNDGTPIRPGDIAILMLSPKAAADTFGEAFARRGIPFHNSGATGFFENSEVLLALCLMNIIDNPTRDIYLAGALRSPIFGFTLSELIGIRRSKKQGALYDALRHYSENTHCKKCAEFLETLDKWRSKAIGMPVDRLLWYIYTETDLMALVYDKDSAVRRANLMLLYEYARRFEASSFKGLYNFIRYVSDIIEEKAQIEGAAVSSEDSDAVQLMTIHHSKGLEYPICFIAGTGKKFNDKELSNNIIIERSLGIATKLSDTTGFARYDTPIRQALVKRLADSQLEEEMRVLYVAMTRARERLYITGEVKKAQKLLDTCSDDAERLSRYVIMRNVGFMRWILTALEHYKLTHDDKPPVTVEIVNGALEDTDTDISDEKEVCGTVVSDELRLLVMERMGFVYPKAAASKLPAKLSVSKLVPTLLDEDAAELDTDTKPYRFEEKRPKFLDSTADAPTGAERGTATHLFMQFCDYSRFKEFSTDIAATVKDEALRLANSRYFTPRMASLVNTEQLAAFFEGDTFAEICAAKKVWREHRFNVRLPASDFTENTELAEALKDETVLVQGVIDCFYENPDGTVTLIDYKTDYVPRGMQTDEAKAMLLDRHRMQLLYYKGALEKISAKKVARVAIYSFALGCEIEVE